MTETAELSLLGAHLGGYRVPCYPFPTRWEHSLSRADWYEHLREQVRGPVSLYVHIPFCESLCSFCGCNTSITRDKAWSPRYTDWLIKEWQQYQQAVPQLAEPKISDMRFGGGTPQFLLMEDIERLFRTLIEREALDENSSIIMEIDPRVSTAEQLRHFVQLGVTDFELGIQDLDSLVQRRIHRYQKVEQVHAVMETLRSLENTVRIGWELIYGLPGQTVESWEKTLNELGTAAPDRVQIYPFFSLPWVKRQSAEGDDSDLMNGEQKEKLSEMAYRFLHTHGYVHLGDGLLVRPADPLALGFRESSLHKHFSGLSPRPTAALIGIGVGAISETANVNYQNVKALPVYQRLSERNEDLGLRAHRLSERDLFVKSIVRNAQTRQALAKRLANVVFEHEPEFRDFFKENDGDFVRFRSAGHVGPFLHRFLQLDEARVERVRKGVVAG